MAERILVVGGSSGIGRGTAELLARRGAEVTVADLKPGSEAMAYVPVELADPASIDEAVKMDIVDGTSSEVMTISRLWRNCGCERRLVISVAPSMPARLMPPQPVR